MMPVLRSYFVSGRYMYLKRRKVFLFQYWSFLCVCTVITPMHVQQFVLTLQWQSRKRWSQIQFVNQKLCTLVSVHCYFSQSLWFLPYCSLLLQGQGKALYTLTQSILNAMINHNCSTPINGNAYLRNFLSGSSLQLHIPPYIPPTYNTSDCQVYLTHHDQDCI